MQRNFFQQFQRMQSPKIILNETEVIKKFRPNDTNSKVCLIAELEELLKMLADVSDWQVESQGLQVKDGIIEGLQSLQKRARDNDHKEIEKLCMLAIGKRILNIELKRKRQQFQKKQQKKSQIQQFFRQNRIKKYDYDSLVEAKLAQNTLIVRPYTSGKGFIGSGNSYAFLQPELLQCGYIEAVRQVNKIFFDIFSGKNKDEKAKIYDVLFKILSVPVIVFLVLILTLPLYTFQHEQIILSVVMAIVVILIIIVTISTYLNVPNSNNQMEQSIQDTRKFFQNLNSENFKNGKQYEWNCPENFMYLQVRFNRPILVKKSTD